MNPAIIIPARLKATRLPRKPLLSIQGTPMIARVLQQAQKAQLGSVYVACDCEEIANIVRNYGGTPILTDSALPSGTDRISAAIVKLNLQNDIIINLQGDLPFIDPALIRKVIEPLQDNSFAIATLGAPIHDPKDWILPQVVKALTRSASNGYYDAFDFHRIIPDEERPHSYHHIGIYAYHRAALQRFVQLQPSTREKERNLEQMRALDEGMKIGLGVVQEPPLSIDTPEDLEKAQLYRTV